jgi:hypothetical protein
MESRHGVEPGPGEIVEIPEGTRHPTTDQKPELPRRRSGQRKGQGEEQNDWTAHLGSP